MQWEHIVMFACNYLITNLDDELVAPVVEPVARTVGVGSSFLQNSVRANHLPWNQIRADAEVFKRALGLSPPKPIGWYFDFAERVFLDSSICIGQAFLLFRK